MGNLLRVALSIVIGVLQIGADAQNVGIGTTSPASKLDVSGGLTVGASYAGTNTAPPNGALIEGNVGIGTPLPSEALDVNGKIRMRTGAVNGYIPVADANGVMTWTDPATLVSSNTLDEAYDEGGAGTGRVITADSGAVSIQGTDGIEVTGILGSGDTIVTTSGSRMFFNPRKAAFRSGIISNDAWDDSNVGDYSFAAGTNTIASGTGSTALGYSTTASANNAQALGTNTTASGNASFAIGRYTTASGLYSVAMGEFTTASGWYSTAMGNQTEAPSANEVVIGRYNTLYTPISYGNWELADRLFVIGNGSSSSFRSDALVVLKNGNVGIGTSSPSRALELSGTGYRATRITSTNANIAAVEFLRTGNGFSDWRMMNSGGIFYIGQSSDDLTTVTDVVRIGGSSLTPASDNFVTLGSSGLRWTAVYAVNGTIQTSDARDKTNMLPLQYGLTEVLKLKPVTYQWKDDPDAVPKIGLIAQDVQQIIPEAVMDWDWEINEESGDRKKVEAQRLGIYYSDLIPVLTKAIQDQQVLIESLQTQVSDLKKEINHK